MRGSCICRCTDGQPGDSETGNRSWRPAGSPPCHPACDTGTRIPAAPSPHHCAYVAFDPAVVDKRLPQIAHLWARSRLLLSPADWPLGSAFRVLIREVAQDRSFGEPAVRAALDLVLIEAARILDESATGTSRIASHPAIARARDLIDEEAAYPWTLEALAAAVGLSRAHLAERFAAEVGRPPYAYLLERRVERCAQLLSDAGRNIADIAADAGFSSSSAMARTFRALLGCSPGQWRKEHAGPIRGSHPQGLKRPTPQPGR